VLHQVLKAPGRCPVITGVLDLLVDLSGRQLDAEQLARPLFQGGLLFEQANLVIGQLLEVLPPLLVGQGSVFGKGADLRADLAQDLFVVPQGLIEHSEPQEAAVVDVASTVPG